MEGTSDQQQQQQQQQPEAGDREHVHDPAYVEDDDDADAADTELEDVSSDEEYNQKNYGIYQALPVEGEPDWTLDEPDSAEEYLRRVRYEAAQCPRVVRVEPAVGQLASQAPSFVLSEPQPIADAPDWAKPNKSWVHKFVADFQQLRVEVQQAYAQGEYPAAPVPHVNDVDGWDRACFGRAAQSELQHSQAAEGAEMTQLTPGICCKIMALEQPEVASLFLRHCQQLEEECPDSLPLLRAQWLFALAARLEKPCHPEVAAGFRALLRHCCKLRTAVTHAADPLLPKLNVLIVMAGAYFAQDEELCSFVDSSELI